MESALIESENITTPTLKWNWKLSVQSHRRQPFKRLISLQLASGFGEIAPGVRQSTRRPSTWTWTATWRWGGRGNDPDWIEIPKRTVGRRRGSPFRGNMPQI
eukprot:1196149-Prorocentrum_minimum.AAC.9